MSKKSDSKTEIAAAGVSGQAQRLSLFGPPLLLEGEDAVPMMSLSVVSARR
jgi:hypothetical protein